MNPSMVMSYLSDLDCNSNVEVNIVRSEICDQIEITTDDFVFVVDGYGLRYISDHIGYSDTRADVEIWKFVKEWVKNYLNEIL